MDKPREEQAQATAQTAEVSLLDQIVDKGRFGSDAPARERGKDMIKQFVGEVLAGTITVARDADAMLNARIAQIDRLISSQVNEIIHAPQFQKLEATWRGLHYLLSQSETSELLKIKVLNVSKKDLLKDLQRAPEFDQSALFKKVYEEEYGVFGGSPFGALLGDYQFDKTGEDVELLEKIAQVSAASHAPFIAGTSPEMFSLESFTQLDQPRDLAKIFAQNDYAKWKVFRDSEDSRYVALTAPRMLLREPYGRDKPIEAFQYEEQVGDHEKYLWGNAAWGLGARVTQAFATYGWCATIRGVESGGLVEGLPVHSFRTDAGEYFRRANDEILVVLRLAGRGRAEGEHDYVAENLIPELRPTDLQVLVQNLVQLGQLPRRDRFKGGRTPRALGELGGERRVPKGCALFPEVLHDETEARVFRHHPQR